MLADGVTPFALSAIKYGLFALLALFVWRATRWAVRGLSVESLPARSGGRRASRGSAPPEEASLPPGPRAIAIIGDGKKPRTVRVTGPMVIGRGSDCQVALDDTYVSEEHARLFAKDSHWYVEDLGSTNGTFVNDQRLATPARVQPGDRVRVGTTVMELRR